MYMVMLLCILTSTNACSKKDNIETNIKNGGTSTTTEDKIINEPVSSQNKDSEGKTETSDKSLDNRQQAKAEVKTESSENTTNNFQPEVNKEYYSVNDKTIITYFNAVDKKVDETLKEDKSEKAKDKLKGTFITIVDFIFYDSEIKGIKFNDLTNEAKQNILDTASMIDSKIMSKYPNYKEEISTKTRSAYSKASELIKKGANNINQFSKDKLGEENYNSIIDAKDDLVYYTKKATSIIGNVTSSIFNTAKSKIKSWYENLKS